MAHQAKRQYRPNRLATFAITPVEQKALKAFGELFNENVNHHELARRVLSMALADIKPIIRRWNAYVEYLKAEGFTPPRVSNMNEMASADMKRWLKEGFEV